MKKLILIMLLNVFVLGGCRNEQEVIKVACVGDSITFGIDASGTDANSYPKVLQKLLGDGYEVKNFGYPGACVNPDGDCPYVGEKTYQRSLDYDADIVIFMIGTNDAKTENWVDSETFIKEYRILLNSYLERENSPKIYIGLCAKTHKVENEDSMYYILRPGGVEEIVETIQDSFATSDADVEILDIYSLTAAHPEWFVEDGVHPNAEGYEAIAKMIADEIKNEY